MKFHANMLSSFGVVTHGQTNGHSEAFLQLFIVNIPNSKNKTVIKHQIHFLYIILFENFKMIF
jgi:hypothetical protein